LNLYRVLGVVVSDNLGDRAAALGALSQMIGLVIGHAILPHPEDDRQPAVGQTAISS
jgi:hypothetical protein